MKVKVDRAKELEDVLQELSRRLVEYAKKADSPAGTVGTLRTPAELKQSLALEVGHEGKGFAGLLESTDMVLQNSVNTWHKCFMEKLYASTNPVGIASDMLLSMLNTNSHVYTASPALTLIEKYIAHEYACMFGFKKARSGGLTFPGGSYSNIMSLHMARSLKFPEIKKAGVRNHDLVLFASEHCHYSLEKAAILLGLGSEAVVTVNVLPDGTMDVSHLAKCIQEAEAQGRIPFYINATAGTTVYGSFDDLTAIAKIAKQHNLWLHVDGSWGGNFIFSKKQKHKLTGIDKADSLTVNPHKMLGVPCTCSFLLVPDSSEFFVSNSIDAPYLFHQQEELDEDYDLANGTMGCGRRADALKLYLSWQWYGTRGYEKRIDHAVAMTEYLADRVDKSADLTLLSSNPPPCLQTCFFYSPNGKLGSKEENTRTTTYIASELFRRSKYLVDYSVHKEYGSFFRVVLNAPEVDVSTVDGLVDEIVSIGNGMSSTSGD